MTKTIYQLFISARYRASLTPTNRQNLHAHFHQVLASTLFYNCLLKGLNNAHIRCLKDVNPVTLVNKIGLSFFAKELNASPVTSFDSTLLVFKIHFY